MNADLEKDSMELQDKLEPYRIVSHTFLGTSESGSYTYEISFNQSLVHTGRFNGIEDGLNMYREDEMRKEEEEILERAENILKKRRQHE